MREAERVCVRKRDTLGKIGERRKGKSSEKDREEERGEREREREKRREELEKETKMCIKKKPYLSSYSSS